MKQKAKNLGIAKKLKDPRKALIKKCDALWSKIIREQPGYCEYCGKWHKIYHAHHIFSRARWATRFVLLNGLKAGAGCHLRIHSVDSQHFSDWIKDKMGERYDRLKLMSQGHFKKSLANIDMIYKQLKAIDKQLSKGERDVKTRNNENR